MEKTNENIGNFLLIIVSIILGVSVISCLYIELKEFSEFVSKFLIGGTIILAILQQRKTKEWNKKQLSITQIHKSIQKIRKILKQLNISFNQNNIKLITERKPEEKILLNEIHKIFGNGNYSPESEFLYYVDSNDENEIENNKNYRELLLSYLGEYEYICGAVNNDIFDKKVVENLLKTQIIRTYFVFEEYIKHLRKIHFKNDRIYQELEKLAKEFKK